MIFLPFCIRSIPAPRKKTKTAQPFSTNCAIIWQDFSMHCPSFFVFLQDIVRTLLPLFCEALTWIAEKNKCCCEDGCDNCDPTKNTDEGIINYATIEGRLQEHFLNILTKQYFNQLSLISLCQGYKGELWGVVV